MNIKHIIQFILNIGIIIIMILYYNVNSDLLYLNL